MHEKISNHPWSKYTSLFILSFMWIQLMSGRSILFLCFYTPSIILLHYLNKGVMTLWCFIHDYGSYLSIMGLMRCLKEDVACDHSYLVYPLCRQSFSCSSTLSSYICIYITVESHFIVFLPRADSLLRCSFQGMQMIFQYSHKASV